MVVDTFSINVSAVSLAVDSCENLIVGLNGGVVGTTIIPSVTMLYDTEDLNAPLQLATSPHRGYHGAMTLGPGENVLYMARPNYLLPPFGPFLESISLDVGATTVVAEIDGFHGIAVVPDGSANPDCSQPSACCVPTFVHPRCEETDPLRCVLQAGTIVKGASVCEGDQDSDEVDALCGDECEKDGSEFVPGVCGCGSPDVDSDNDTVLDCQDLCPNFDDLADYNHDGEPDCTGPIPTLSQWGVTATTLLMLIGGKIAYARSGAAAHASEADGKGPKPLE